MPKENIDVWVREDERAEYEDVTVNATVHSHDRPLGLKHARDAILDYYPIGTRLVQSDDDIVAFSRLVGKRLQPVTTLPRHIEHVFDLCDEYGFGLWGVKYTDNPFYMKSRISTSMRLVSGVFFGFTTTGSFAEHTSLDEKEDVQRSVQFGTRDGGMLVLDYLTVRTLFYGNDGGMQTYRTDESVEEGSKKIVEMYPDYLRYVPADKTGYGKSGVRVRTRKPRVAPLPEPEWEE